MKTNFAHLHLHNEYSALDGYGSAEQFVLRAKELDFKYLALTNHGNIAGCLKFQNECEKHGIEPIIGCEAYIVPNANIKAKEKRAHIVILVTNETGWTELCRILSEAGTEGFYNKPRIDYDSLLNADKSGWVILSGCVGGFLTLKGGKQLLSDLAEEMEGRLFLEIMPHTMEMQTKYHDKYIFPARKKTDLPYIATNDCHYVLRSDAKVQDVLLAIQNKKTWDDPSRWAFDFRNLHLRSEKEMRKAFGRQDQFDEDEIDEAISNTVKVAKMCAGFRIPKRNISLPSPPGLGDQDENEALREMCEAGLERWPKKVRVKYTKRFEREFKSISTKGFSKYFLIAEDIIRFCKEADIMVGPGRGSVGGCLIAYLIGITKTNPIKWGLSFERFISDDRIDWPDIDLDFESHKRHLIVEYIEDTYGKDHVCGISTESRLKSKSVLWDVGRVFEVPRNELSEITQAVRADLYPTTAVKECIENDRIGQKFAKAWPDVAKIAMRLENQIRHYGQHPAAVVISKEPLTNGYNGSLRLQKGNIVSSWDMEDSEYGGLMKLDILALSTLSVLSECRRLINKTETDWDFDEISYDDDDIFEMLSKGETSGIFQFSARAMTELSKEMGIESINDMVAAVALCRPGPNDSGMTAKFVERKHGKGWTGTNDIYEEITKDTYGLLVYQEQVMKVISKVAGLPESTADKIRKVIGKKRDKKEFAQYKKMFLNGCIKEESLDKDEAKEFWEGLEEWAKYGFNKSHSVEYALIAYWTAWCKVNYTPEFICSCLTYSKKDEKQKLIDDALALDIQILLPKIDISDALKWMIGDNGKIYVPFAEINTVGEEGAKKICKPKSDKGNVGFFALSTIPNTKTQTGRILREIGAYNPEELPDRKTVKKHFGWSLSTDLYGDGDYDDEEIEEDEKKRAPKMRKDVTRRTAGKPKKRTRNFFNKN